MCEVGSKIGRRSAGRLGVAAVLVALGLCLATPGHAQTAPRRIAVVAFDGAKAQSLRRVIIDSLAASGHAVNAAVEVDEAAKTNAVAAGCPDPSRVTGLAKELSAEAVLCGTIAGVPWKRKLTLVLYNGFNGTRRKDYSIALRSGGNLTRAAFEAKRAPLDAGIAATTRYTAKPASPAQPGDLSQLPNVIYRLSSRLPADRLMAVSDLAYYDHWQAMVPMSCAVMTDSELSVRKLAAEKMEQLHDVAIQLALRSSAVLEPDDTLRNNIRAGLMNRKKVLAVLLEKLKSPDRIHRAQAARALGQSKYPDTIEPMLKATKDTSPIVRMRAVEGMRNFVDPRARQAVVNATKDVNDAVRKVAEQFIKEQKRLSAWRSFYMSYMRVVKKTESQAPAWREEAVLALGLSVADNAVPRLITMLNDDPAKEVRLAAAWSLMLMGTERAQQALAKASTSDRDPFVKRVITGFSRLAQMSDDQLVARLVAPKAEDRYEAALDLSLKTSNPLVHYLIRSVLCDPDEQVRKAVLMGLARLGIPMAIDAIKLVMFRDPSDDVRRAAMMAYVLVGWKDMPEPEPEAVKGDSETSTWVTDTEDPIADQAGNADITTTKRRATPKKPTTPRCPLGWCRSFALMVGPASLFTRSLSVDVGDSGQGIDGDGLNTTPVMGLDVGGEIYPATFFTKGWLANLGMAFHYRRYFGLSWKNTEQQTSSTFKRPNPERSITFQAVDVDFLRFRWQPVRSVKVPTLIPRFGLRYHQFAMNDEVGDRGVAAAHIPDVSITALNVGLLIDLPISVVMVQVGFDYLAVTKWGEITEESTIDATDQRYSDLAGYGPGSGWGMMVTGGLRGWFSGMFGWKLNLNYTRFSLDFEGKGDRLADASADQYFHGSLYLMFGF